jgi:ABC-type transport system substrate-binding protein
VAVAALVATGCSDAGDGEDAGGGETTSDTAPVSGEGLTFIADDPGEPRQGGSLNYGLSAETDGWRTTDSRWATSSYTVGKAIFDPLAAYDEDDVPQPYLAESWESNEDFTVWTIALREGVTFHDGDALDAEAVVANLEAHRGSALTGAAMENVADGGIQAVDELTVEIRTKRPWSSLPFLLESQVGYMMAPSMLESPEGARNPVGTGPFVFGDWQTDRYLDVTANPDYWQEGLPYLDSVRFDILKDTPTRGRALETGQVQAMETNDARQIIDFRGRAEGGEFQMYTDADGETSEIFIGLNTSKPPFDDPLAREILATGLDTESLSEAAFDGLFPPARGPFQPASPEYVETDYPTYDEARAIELHDEYQAKHGEPLAFTANIIPTPEIQAIAQTLQQQGARAGVEVTLNSIDQATLISNAITGNYEATGFILFGAPSLDREYVFIADVPEGSPLNFTRNRNETLIEAMDAARSTDDPEERRAQHAIVQQEMAKDLNFIWLVHQVAAVVYAPDVHGLDKASFPEGGDTGRIVAPFLTQAWRAG